MMMDDQLENTQKLEAFLKALEEERSKVEAFKKELPYCMQLLNDAIQASKQYLSQCRSKSAPAVRPEPLLEEFIPLKKGNEKLKKEESLYMHLDGDKPRWMTEAQLWTHDPKAVDTWPELMTGKPEQKQLDDPSIEARFKSLSNSIPSLNPKQRSSGAFSPFVKTKPCVPAVSEAELKSPFPSLGHEDHQESPSFVKYGGKSDSVVATERTEASEIDLLVRQQNGACAASESCSVFEKQRQQQRKARRCWSPELHRQFVHALQQLGGPQVATPKQIRDLMKVEGLTNDEVKSHLQKYRLHTRRPSPVPQAAAATPSAQLVVLGSIWVSPAEYNGSSVVLQDSGVYAQISQDQPCFQHSNPSASPSSTAHVQLRHATSCEDHKHSPFRPNSTVEWQRQRSIGTSMALAHPSTGDHEKDSSGEDDVQSDNTTSGREGNVGREKTTLRDSMAGKKSIRKYQYSNVGEHCEEYDDGDLTEAEDERTLGMAIS